MSRHQRWTVRLHQGRAVVWALAYVVTVAFGVTDSVALVWFASVYANVVSDLGAAAATDDRVVLDAIRELREEIAQLRKEVQRDRDS